MKRKPTSARAGGRRSDRPSCAVLIVEDNRDIAVTLAELLRARGHTVEVAHDASAALKVVQRFRPSVALLDLGLPVTDGCELAVLLRQQTGLGRLRLVAMTGAVRPSDVARARRAGFSEHFAKPFDIDSLVASVERRRQRS